ncbi:RagB/SusD family nutrient uptake outer membrane protein [Lutibacter sp. HS1-25]|uniref:RagB/SusD family nutrient uptake outer membrane protein n=1 Tax=Lutibacter sp. HS1-25 TaxID=2485000 RepID=UPI00101161A7|nr:RagB/SusD family nutrient uptake outer membrane protein [Lutibacter sp. HS1-25]RXP45223.1 RagB/SusD family nutrient uptake outer membrane protein [Lutibacter sp. HS1-25]
MKQIKFLIILLLGVFVSSCSDFLSPEPISAISTDNYYKNDIEIETGILNMYNGIQGLNSTDTDDNHAIQVEYLLTEVYCDNGKTKSSEGEQAQFEEFKVSPSNGYVSDYYGSFYNVIYRSNLVLENLGNASDANKASYEAEAKFVRGYAYFNLVRLFGDVPLVDKIIQPLDTETQFTRVAEDQIYELIISDLTTAVNGLGAGTYGRASKATAQAILAKVYLTLGEYTLAKELLVDAMASGYSLEPNFKDVFYNEGNKEVMFAIVYDGDTSNDSQNFSAEWQNAVGRSTGLNYVTDEAAAAMLAMGGNRTAYTYRVDPKNLNLNQVAKYIPNGDTALGIEPTSINPVLAGNDWIVLRYADVLLMYVEATMGTADATSDITAVNAFNLVRSRANMPTVNSITKQELLDERRVEFAFENQRFFDLKRFGVAQQVLSQYSADNGYGFTATDLLLPIPQLEIGLSKGVLKQNPGY